MKAVYVVHEKTLVLVGIIGRLTVAVCCPDSHGITAAGTVAPPLYKRAPPLHRSALTHTQYARPIFTVVVYPVGRWSRLGPFSHVSRGLLGPSPVLYALRLIEDGPRSRRLRAEFTNFCVRFGRS